MANFDKMEQLSKICHSIGNELCLNLDEEIRDRDSSVDETVKETTGTVKKRKRTNYNGKLYLFVVLPYLVLMFKLII